MISVQTQGSISCEEVTVKPWHGQSDGKAHLEPEDAPGHQPDAPGVKAPGGVGIYPVGIYP